MCGYRCVRYRGIRYQGGGYDEAAEKCEAAWGGQSGDWQGFGLECRTCGGPPPATLRPRWSRGLRPETWLVQCESRLGPGVAGAVNRGLTTGASSIRVGEVTITHRQTSQESFNLMLATVDKLCFHNLLAFQVVMPSAASNVPSLLASCSGFGSLINELETAAPHSSKCLSLLPRFVRFLCKLKIQGKLMKNHTTTS